MVPFQPWSEFLDAFQWRQGEHVSLIGPTGGGKTTLALAILPLRTYTVVLGTKPRDPTLDALQRNLGYRRIYEWTPRPGERRVLLWPKLKTVTSFGAARPVFRAALDDIYERGGWTIYVDEAFVLSDPEYLNLRGRLRLMLTQGRSVNITVVAGTQRPAWVPLELYDQASHLFLWRDNDRRNLDRLSGLGGLDSRTIRDAVATLGQHETLYVGTRDGSLVRTKVETPLERRTRNP